MYSREQMIRERAYEIWQADGEPFGRDLEHWYRAEHQFSPEPTDMRSDTVAISDTLKGGRRKRRDSAVKSEAAMQGST